MPEAPRGEGVVLPRILGLDPGTDRFTKQSGRARSNGSFQELGENDRLPRDPAAGAALASFESVLAPAPRTRAFVEWTPARADAVARSLGIVLGPDQWRVIACARELEATAPGHVQLDDLALRLGKELTEIRALFPEPLLDTLVALAGLTR